MMAQFFFEFFESQQTWEHWVASQTTLVQALSRKD